MQVKQSTGTFFSLLYESYYHIETWRGQRASLAGKLWKAFLLQIHIKKTIQWISFLCLETRKIYAVNKTYYSSELKLVLEILKCQLRWRLWRRTAKAESVPGLKYLVLEKGNGLPIAKHVDLGIHLVFGVGLFMLGFLGVLSVFQVFVLGLEWMVVQ